MRKIVLVEDNPIESAEIVATFVANNFSKAVVTKVEDLSSQSSDTKVDLLLLDINLPTTKSLRNLALAKSACGDTPIIVLTDFLSPETRTRTRTRTRTSILASGAINVLDKANLDSLDLVGLAISAMDMPH